MMCLTSTSCLLVCKVVLLQAMDLISIAQSSGDISAELYRQKSAKPIETPQLAGLEQHHQKLMAEAQQANNPFTNGASTSANSSPGGKAPLLPCLVPILHSMHSTPKAYSNGHCPLLQYSKHEMSILSLYAELLDKTSGL